MTQHPTFKRHGKRRICLFAASTAVLASFPFALHAQVTTATLSGTVEDTASSVVPGATITLKNTLNGGVRTATSNGAGLFSFPAVPTGDYQVVIKANGFENYTATEVHLDPGDQRALRDIHLSVGSEAQNVTVTADTQINLDSGEQSSLISAEQIKHLSVEGRDVTELLKTLPGFSITNGNDSVDNRAYDPSQVSVGGALGSYAGNGTPINGVALLTDGADITDPGNFGSAIQNVNYEEVAEVKVQTSSFTADTAHGPIVINAVGKSGGDHFHGSLYTYARTNQLDSNDWIGNYTGQAKAPDRQVYPGLTFGGPVLIPGTSFNRNRHLTFFVGGEDYAQRNVYAYGSAGSAILQALTPTQAMRNGDFSQASLAQFLGPNYNPIITPPAGTMNPLPAYASCNSGNYNSNCGVPQTAPNGAPLVNGNIAPYIDKGAQVLINNLPLPNQPTTLGGFNYITTNLVDNDLYEAHARIDDQISDKNKLFLVYTKEAGKNGVPQNEYYSPRGGTYGGVNIPGGGLLSTINSETGSFNYTSVIGPTLTNELFGQGAYLLQDFVAKDQNALSSAAVGYPYRGVYANGDPQYPQLQDYSNIPLALTSDTSGGGIYARKWIRGGGDNVTKLFGPHTVKIGFFTELTNNNEVNAYQTTNGAVDAYSYNAQLANQGNPVFNTGYNTGLGTPTATNNGGNTLANFLEGHVSDFNQQNISIHPDLYFWNISGYAQDHYRVSPRVTVDVGVRFEHLGPWNDTRKDGIPVWDPANYADDAFGSPLPGFLWHGIDSKIPKSGLSARWAYVEPRVGVAWDPHGNGQTVVRAGYGIYRAHDSYNDATAGIGTSEGQLSTTVSQVTLATASAQQIPVTGGSFGTSKVYGFFANDDNQPQVYTYNFAVDQKLIANSVLEVAYVGNRSDHLLDNGANQTVNLDDQNALPIGAAFPGGVIPASIGTVTSTTGNLQPAVYNLLRKYPKYQNILIGQHRLYANFNALETSWSKQQGKLLYGVNYTFSKALGVLGGYNNGLPSDPFNLRNDYLPETYDRTHEFTANYTYLFGTLVHNRYAGAVANGWELSGITQIQSGQNLQSYINPNFGLTGSLGSTTVTGTNNLSLLGTPDVLLQPVVTCDPSVHVAPHQFVNASCFTLPTAPGINGNHRFPYTHAPAFTDTDLTATKDIHVREGSDLQLRFAAFNFINHANTSFVSQYGQETQLNLGNPVDTTQEASAASQNASFGLAPLREGRRISEVSLKYTF